MTKLVLTVLMLLLPVAEVSAASIDGARQNYERWQTLTQPQQAALFHSYEHFQSLPADQRAQIEHRFAIYKQLSPEQKQSVREIAQARVLRADRIKYAGAERRREKEDRRQDRELKRQRQSHH